MPRGRGLGSEGRGLGRRRRGLSEVGGDNRVAVANKSAKKVGPAPERRDLCKCEGVAS